MTCEECEEILLVSDMGPSRMRWMPGVSVLNLAKQHAQNCPACAARMAEISKMNDALDQLRFSTKQMEAPETIEMNLLVEFRQRALRAPSLPITFRRRVLCGSALLLALAAGIVSYAVLRAKSSMTTQTDRTERPAQRSAPPLHSGTSLDRAAIENQQTGTDRPQLAKSKPEHRTRLGRPARKVPSSSVPANDELSLNGGSNVVRVTLPLASLVAMGVPMSPEISDRRITADVTRDPFGAVIAVHLVETRPSTD
jgi:anti-sigma factor RsiW